LNVLDENIIESQRQMLRGWRIAIHQIGFEIGRKAMKDQQISPLLNTLARPILFTRDIGFYDRALLHQNYGLVVLDVRPQEAAHFIRRGLSHPHFATKARRMGAVLKASHTGINSWRLHAQEEIRCPWIV
jgi:hypothetical protein